MHSWHISSSLIWSFKERVHIVAKVKIKHLSISCQSVLEQSVLRRLNVMFFTKLKAFSKPHKNDLKSKLMTLKTQMQQLLLSSTLYVCAKLTW